MVNFEYSPLIFIFNHLYKHNPCIQLHETKRPALFNIIHSHSFEKTKEIKSGQSQQWKVFKSYFYI